MTLESVARAVCSARGLQYIAGVGQGGFKETYEVTSAAGESIALKILKPGSSMARPEREIEAMMRCHHPNIATLLDVGTIAVGGAKHVFLLEEFLSGGTLTSKAAQAHLSTAEVKQLIVPLIDAVGHIL